MATNPGSIDTGPSEADFAADIMQTLAVNSGDDSALDNLDFQPPSGEPSSAPASEAAGEGVAAPSSSPVTPPAPASPEPTPSPAAPAPAPVEPQPSPAPATPTPQPAAPTLTPPSEDVLRQRSLEATVEALQNEIAALRAAPSSQPAPGTPAQPESGQPQIERYALTPPPALADALLSEDGDVRLRATMQLVNDTATIVHHKVIQQVGAYMQQLFNGAQRDQATHENISRMEQGRAQYYERFPQHNNALYLPIIQAESAKLATEYPNLPWGDEFMNSLGARVNAAVEALQPGQPVVPPPAPVAAPSTPVPPRPAPSIPSGGPRPSAPAGGELNLGDEILETLEHGLSGAF